MFFCTNISWNVTDPGERTIMGLLNLEQDTNTKNEKISNYKQCLSNTEEILDTNFRCFEKNRVVELKVCTIHLSKYTFLFSVLFLSFVTKASVLLVPSRLCWRKSCGPRCCTIAVPLRYSSPCVSPWGAWTPIGRWKVWPKSWRNWMIKKKNRSSNADTNIDVEQKRKKKLESIFIRCLPLSICLQIYLQPFLFYYPCIIIFLYSP